ncbi:helix-turn-helix transcriptional regulator [Roseiconus lacunae]|uniref:Helix-turn-helix domain-containing protein n=1 Tax=Roseiconus lacunae TaxID=2605694 RepID=A0ABT7PMQ3_9BACT|nr:hypothetical protein [Roseiconus lacunae]MDM4017766.1 hypothetical protein [Roseiconus lacunae]
MSSQPPVLYAADLNQVASTIATAVTQLVRESIDVQAAPGQLVDVNEMARRSGVSSSTLERRVKGGSVPSIKIGSRRLFDPDAVFAALNGDQSKPSSEQPEPTASGVVSIPLDLAVEWTRRTDLPDDVHAALYERLSGRESARD